MGKKTKISSFCFFNKLNCCIFAAEILLNCIRLNITIYNNKLKQKIMKKFFTSIVIALCAMSMNAQETIAIDADATYNSDQTISSENCSLTFGAGDTWTAKAAGLGDFTAYVSGANNPKDAEGQPYSAETKNLPVGGTYYVVKTKVAGTVSFAMVLNANKAFFVVKKSDAAALGSSALTLTDKSGATVELDASNKVAEKFYGNVEFKAEANTEYLVFCNGSKLGFYGLTFTAGGESAIANISADKANENAPVYNLNGQKVSKDYKGVVVKNGKKYVQK